MCFDLTLMVICPATKCKTNGFKALRPRSIIFCASSFFHKSCSCSNQSIKFSESLFLIPCQTCGKSSYTFFSNITFIIDMHYTTHDDGAVGERDGSTHKKRGNHLRIFSRTQNCHLPHNLPSA